MFSMIAMRLVVPQSLRTFANLFSVFSLVAPLSYVIMSDGFTWLLIFDGYNALFSEILTCNCVNK